MTGRGDAKAPYMEKFLIFQARQKDSSKTQSSKKEIANSDHKYAQRIWMTAEIMDKKSELSKRLLGGHLE